MSQEFNELRYIPNSTIVITIIFSILYYILPLIPNIEITRIFLYKLWMNIGFFAIISMLIYLFIQRPNTWVYAERAIRVTQKLALLILSIVYINYLPLVNNLISLQEVSSQNLLYATVGTAYILLIIILKLYHITLYLIYDHTTIFFKEKE